MSAAQGAGGNARKSKVVLLGSSGCGKSSLVVRLCKDEFVTAMHSTVGSSFFKYAVNLDEVEGASGSGAAAKEGGGSGNNTIHFDIWDTAGQERFKSLARMYYRGAAAIVVVYEITSVETFEVAKGWVRELQAQENAVIVLVGNKVDLEESRAVPRDEGAAFASEHNIEHFESSARTGQGVKHIFNQIAVKLSKLTTVAPAPAGGIRVPSGGVPPPPKKNCAC